MAVELLEARERSRYRTRSAVDHGREDVIVQVAPDAGKVDDDIDSEAAELVGGPDAGEQQELGRLDRPRADHDLALGADLLDRTPSLDFDADAT
jgi:hypothetical protein